MSFRFNRLLLCADDKRRWSLTKTRSCADQIHVRFVDGMHMSWNDLLVDRLRVCCRAIFVEYSLEPEGSRRVLVILRTWVCHASVWCIGIPRNWTRDEQRDRARKGYFILVVSISWEQWTIVKVFRCSTLSLSLSPCLRRRRGRENKWFEQRKRPEGNKRRCLAWTTLNGVLPSSGWLIDCETMNETQIEFAAASVVLGVKRTVDSFTCMSLRRRRKRGWRSGVGSNISVLLVCSCYQWSL